MMQFRRKRRFAAWVVVLALLSMQVAVAGYICPAAAPAMAPDCTSAMPMVDDPTLCKAHGDSQTQFKGDQAPLPLLAPAVVLALLLPPEPSIRTDEVRAASYAQVRLTPDGSPPIFVRDHVFLK